MEKASRDFNTTAKFCLGLSMVCVALTIVSSSINIRNYKYFGWDTSILVKEIVLDALILGAGVLTFLKKRIGLNALVVLFIIRLFATIPQGGYQSMASKLGANFVPFVRDFGPFAIAMCFRKNGISGWKAMRLAEKHNTNKSSKTSCIDENLKARNARDSVLVGEPSCSPNKQSLQETIAQEPPFDSNSVIGEEVIKPSESPQVLSNSANGQIEDAISNDIPTSEIAEAEPSTCAETSEKNRITELEAENALLKQMYAELALQKSRKKE